MNEISKRIAYYIKLREMSYGELSNRTGIPKSALFRYAEGKTEKIPIDRVEMIAKALYISPRDILGWQDDSPAPQPIDDDDAELMEYLDMLRSRPECRLLLKTHKDSTKEEVLILSSQEKAFILWLRSLPPEKRQAVLNFQDMF